MKILLSLCMLLPACGSANDLMTAYRQALDHDPVMQSAAADRAVAVEAVPQARAQFMPQLSSQGSIVRENQTFGQSINTSGPQTAVDTKITGNIRDYGVTLTQTLWSFEAFEQLKEAGLLAMQAQASYLNEQRNLILRVAQAYFNILSADDQLSTVLNQRRAFAELLRQANIREQTGLSARTDVAEAQSFYDGTEPALIDARNALEDARRGLAQITGTYAENVARLQQDIPLVGPTPDSSEEWAEAARKDNLDVRVASVAADAASRQIQVERAVYLPTLSLQGSIDRTKQNTDFGGNTATNLVGVFATWPIYQGGSVQSAVRQSKAAYDRAQAQLEIARRQADRSARLAFANVSTGVSRVKSSQRAADSSRTAVEASQHGVEFGTRHEFDLLNSQNNYFNAQLAYFQSRYDYLTAVLQLKQAAGRLEESDLKRIDELLVQDFKTGAE